jgi:hypothetical protein
VLEVESFDVNGIKGYQFPVYWVSVREFDPLAMPCLIQMIWVMNAVMATPLMNVCSEVVKRAFYAGQDWRIRHSGFRTTALWMLHCPWRHQMYPNTVSSVCDSRAIRLIYSFS